MNSRVCLAKGNRNAIQRIIYIHDDDSKNVSYDEKTLKGVLTIDGIGEAYFVMKSKIDSKKFMQGSIPVCWLKHSQRLN